MRKWLGPVAFACLLVGSAATIGCKGSEPSDDADDNGGRGGGGGGGGKGGGGGGGKGGSGGSEGGEGGTAGDSGGVGGMAGMGGQTLATLCKDVVRDTTRPAAITEPDADPTAQLPVKVTFDSADDLTGKFFKKGEATHTSEAGGALKVVKGQRAVLTYDSTPDETPTDTFGAFTATVTFRSERPIALWLGFATDKNRNDGEAIRFAVNKQRHGPAGISDVDTFWFYDSCLLTDLGPQDKEVCFSEPLCADGDRVVRSESYAWTHFDPSSEPQKVKITVVPDKAAKTIRAWAEFVDKDGVVVDGTERTWTNVKHTAGEITLGLAADPDADAFIDEFEVKQAESIPGLGVTMLDDSPVHIWVPENLQGKPVKGIIISDPVLMQKPDAVGESALFGHLRRFARAWGWALVGGVRSDRGDVAMHFQSDMDKLVTKTGRQELKTVPLFIHSLLDTLAYQVLADENLNKRVIGFMLDKPRFGGDLNNNMPEKLDMYPMTDVGRMVPGFVLYSAGPVSFVANRNSGAVKGIWLNNRFHPWIGDRTATAITGALWAMTVHGIQTHAVVDSWALYLAFLQELIQDRTNGNDGKLPLKAVDASKGHLGSSPFLLATTKEVMSSITPFTKFPDPPATFSDVSIKVQPDFVYGKATSLVWQAFDYYRQSTEGDGIPLLPPIQFVPKKVWWRDSPKHGKVGESRKLVLSIDSSLNGWKKVEFFDSASPTPLTPLATVNAGGTAEHEFTNLSVGAHNFIAHVTDASDVKHATFPVMAVMEP